MMMDIFDGVVSPEIGQKVKITTKGIWGHRANTHTCVVSGLMGKYPERKIRLTEIGNNSIHADKFSDFILDKLEYFLGSETVLYFVDDIKDA